VGDAEQMQAHVEQRVPGSDVDRHDSSDHPAEHDYSDAGVGVRLLFSLTGLSYSHHARRRRRMRCRLSCRLAKRMAKMVNEVRINDQSIDHSQLMSVMATLL
jgi:hypothetical protein